MSRFKWQIIQDYTTNSSWSSGTRNTSNLTKTIYQNFDSSGCLYADVQVVWAMKATGAATAEQLFALAPRRINGLDIFITYPGQRYPTFDTRATVPIATDVSIPVGSYIGSARGFIAQHGGQYLIGTGVAYLMRVPLFPSGGHRISLSPNLDIEESSMTVDIRVRTYTLGDGE